MVLSVNLFTLWRIFPPYDSVYLLRNPYIFMFTYLLLLSVHSAKQSVQTSYLLARIAFAFLLNLP